MSQIATVNVIGATSPFGLSLVPFLVAAGYRVNASYRSIDLVPDEWPGDDRIEIFKHELIEPDDELPPSDAVIWLAHIDAGRYNQRETKVNLDAFERLLSKLHPLPSKVIFVSSGGSVYGPANILPIPEDHPRDPLSTYGKAKKALEDRLVRFGNETGVGVTILRPGNIYGFERPDRKTKGVTAAFLRALISGDPFTIIHGGQTVRDFVYVDDVSGAVVSALRSELKEIVWNVGTGIGTSTRSVLDLLLELTGKEMPTLEEKENFSSDVLSSVLDVSLIEKESGWHAKTSLSDGMKRTLEHWSDQLAMITE